MITINPGFNSSKSEFTMDIDKELLKTAMNTSSELRVNLEHYINDAITSYNEQWQLKEEEANINN